MNKKIIIVAAIILGLAVISILLVTMIGAIRTQLKNPDNSSLNGPDTSPTQITPTQPVTVKPEISTLSIDSDEGWPSIDAKYITAMPVDLTQIEKISKYRSCAGHDNSGYSFEKNLETDRSMKHYFHPVPAFQATLNKVKMFAPFNGTVAKMTLESDEIGKPGKRPYTGNGITFSTPLDKNVGFIFAHVYFVRDFKIGDKIKAGELIGYAAMAEKINDFDIFLEGRLGPADKKLVLGSIFDHMTDSVLAEFAKYGVTPDNTKITKEYRDQHPCNYSQIIREDFTGNDWVRLKH